MKDKYTILTNSSIYNTMAVERIKEFFYELTKTNKDLFCPEFYFFPGLRIPFDVQIFDEIVKKVKLQNQIPPALPLVKRGISAFQIYCHGNINFGVRLSEEQGAYKTSLNLFIPTSYLQPEGNMPREAGFRKAENVKRKEIKPIDLLDLFGRMLAALEKPYGSVAPQSNREQFKKIRRVIDTEKVPEAIYWLHHFGQTQVNVIGLKRLKKTPCHKILETQNGILLIMLEDLFNQSCEEHRMLQTEIHQYLRLDALHRQYVKLPEYLKDRETQEILADREFMAQLEEADKDWNDVNYKEGDYISIKKAKP